MFQKLERLYRRKTDMKGIRCFLEGIGRNISNLDDEVLIKRHFPNCQIKTIQKAGHWLHAENPKAFYNEVINFIQ